MADVNANIGVNIDTSDALSQLKNLQRQISQFHNSVAKSSESAGQAQRNLQKNFLNSVNAIEGFSAELRTVRTTAESFSNSLEKNKLSMREYFRFAASQTKTFGKSFGAEFSTIEKTAIERVKTMQTQFIKMGRDANGAMQAIAIRPTALNMKDLGTQTAIAAQKQVIFNQLIKQGSTNLLNFGKNTQWAGRQLMVGFTLPLATLGLTAGRVFMDMEKAAIKFKKVYGDLFTAPEETEAAMESIVELGKAYTAYGIAVSDSLSLAGDAAAAGFSGADLQNQTNAALKLSVLGQLELNQALETTISLQNAFGISSANLAGEIDFLNAVENQTVVSLDDITTAIPKVAPVVKALGGDVRDLAFFMAAMKEGGINASEGANALKSGLASLINPTDRARQMLSGFGVNLRGIIDANQGDVTGVVVDFAKALDQLDPLNRAQAIEQLFGKFQFARLSTLFANVAADGTQASRVLDLAGASLEELASLSENELGVAAESSMNKFLSAVENIKLALAPIGETFLQIATPIIEFGTKMLESFNSLPDGIKKSIATVITVIGGIGPIALMTFGLINNGIANMIKFFATVRLGYLRITGQAKGVGDETQYMTNEQLEAAAAAASLDQAHAGLTQRFTAEKIAVDALRVAYEQAVAAGSRFAMLNPGMMKPGKSAAASAPRMAKGGILSGPGNGKSDSILSWLSNGEAVIPADVVEENPELIKALIAGGLKIPGFAKGTEKASLYGGSSTMLSGGGVPFALGNSASSALGMSKEFFSSDAFTKMFTAGAVGASFKASAGKGEQMNLAKLQPFIDESEANLIKIVETLRQSEAELVSAGKQISSFEDISENAKIKLQQIFDEMTARGGKASQVAKTVKEEMLFPTKESIQASNLSETRARAVKSSNGKLTETAFRVGAQSTRGQSGANRAASLMFPDEVARLKAQGSTSFAHLNEKRLGGPQVPFSGGILNSPDMAMQAAAMERLKAASEAQAKKYPEGQLVTREQAKKQGKEAGVAFNEGAKETAKDTFVNSRDRNSPHKQAAKDGSDDGKAYSAAFQEEVSGATPAAQAKQGPRRVATQGNVIWDAQSKQYQDQAKMAQITESRQKGFARATQMSINKVQGFTKAASGASFAIASVAGLATMAGGKIGEFAGVVMQLTGLFGSLMIVTSQLMATKRAEAAMSLVNTITSGKLPDGTLAPTKGFRGGAKGMAGMQNVIKNVGQVLARLIPGLGALARGIAMVVGFLGGPLTIAIAALIAIIAGGVVAYKIARDNVTALGETANLSAEKLNKLGEMFDVTARMADFSGKFTGTTAKSGEEQTKVNMVLESENFEKDFKTQIEAIKSASSADAESVLKSLTTQLSAAGFESDAVEAIVNAIAIKAGRKDLDLSFSSIKFSSPEGLAAIDTVAKETVARVDTAFAGKNIWDNLGLGDFTKQLTTASAQFTTAFEALQIGFREGEISAEDLISSMGNLNAAIMSLDPSAAKDLVDILAKDLGIQEKISGLERFEDKILLINAATAEIEIPEKVVRALAKASKAGASKKDLETAAKLRKEINQLIADETKKLEDAKDAEEQKAIMTAAVQDAQVGIGEQITALEQEATAYQILIDAGWDAASAMTAVADASVAQGLAMAATADERQGLINDLATLMQLRAEADARKASVSGGGGGGGGATKSAMQEALESLGKQRTEIKNNIAAYNGLRKAGLSAAAASEAAGDATLAAALASTKVGSKEWKALVNQIKLVRIEALKTSDGIRNAFSGLKNQADEYYDILEQQVERKYADGLRAAEKQAKSLNRAIEDLNDTTAEYQEQIDDIQRDIEIQFDRPIEALNEESSDLANDLTLMDKAADKITKRYDEQATALESVNKINQRIIAQQKQQVGLASALVEGDVAAAAAAVQDIRAANAEAAGQTQGEMLNVAKQAELDSLKSASGMSRVEIEERQFQISQLIYGLEEQREVKLAAIQVIEDKIYKIQETQIEPLEAQLKKNEDITQEIEDRRDAEIEAIDAQRQKWDDAAQALQLSRIKAGEFNNVINMAKELTGDVVADWEALADKTTTLTIKTVIEEMGGAPTNAAIVQESGGGGGGGGKPVTPTTPTSPTTPSGATAEPAKTPEPFGWLKDSMEEVGSWWDTFVNQPWVKSLAAMAIGTYNVFIKPIVDWITEQWNKFAAWFDETVIQPIKDGWAAISAWVDTNVIQPVKRAWEKLSTWFDTTIIQPIKDGWASITGWVDTNVIAPVTKGFEDFFGWFNKDDTMENKIADVEKFWGDTITNLKSVGSDIWAGFTGIGTWIGTQANSFSTWVTEDLPAAISQGGEDLWNGMQDIGTWLGEQWTAFETWLRDLPYNIIYAAGYIWEMMTEIGPWLDQQLANIETWFTVTLPAGIAEWGASVWQGMQDVGAWLTTQWESFMTWMTEDLPAGIAEWGASVWQGMQDVGAWLATQWTNFQTWMTVTLPAGIAAWGASVWQGVQNVAEWLSTQFNNFRTWLTVTLPAGIAAWGASLWQGIQNIGAWLTTQWENFRTWLTVTLPNGITNWARNMWTVGLPNLIDWLAARAREIQNWFSTLPARIAGWAAGIWDPISNFISGAFNDGRQGRRADRNATGGMIYRNAGGDVPGEGNTDTVSAMLTPGEYVVNKRATSKFRPVLQAINSGTFGGGLDAMRYQAKAPTYSPSNLSGGVYNVPSRGMSTTPGSMVSTQQISSTQMDNSVYNYSLSVNVNGSNANADDIANNVISKIKRMDSQRLRKQVVG